MGCISSKVIARSICLSEGRKKGSYRETSNNGIPLLEDIIISANNSSDRYLALLLHSRSFSTNAASKLAIVDDEPASSETIDKLEITSTSLVEEDGEEELKEIGSIDQIKRSKSCHFFLPENDVPSVSQENSSGFEQNSDISSRRSRSFHTVEEYDDLVRRIWLSKSLSFQQCDQFNDKGNNKDSGANDNHHNSSSIEDKIILPSQNLNASIEKGNKRNAIAKRLESLRIPSSNEIECPSIASLREWIPPTCNIYSPGSYVTPKFGSYSSSSSLMVDAGRNACEDSSSLFSPELVSAFEECMQKLEAEEENILKQIMDLEEENKGETMKSQERRNHP